LAANPFATIGKLGDLKRRLIFLVAALVVYRIGTFIPSRDRSERARAPVQPDARRHPGHVQHVLGRALSRFSIFALGIMPYISASIIMQLMTVVSPTLEALKKEGEAGRRKITQYTRYGTVVLSLFQALGISIALESQPGS
jgi:preprotein translocase subunit SecY